MHSISFANSMGPWICIYLYVVVQAEDTYLAFEASIAAVSSLSFILFKILKQNLNVAIDELTLLESISVKVHLALTCYFNWKYD